MDVVSYMKGLIDYEKILQHYKFEEINNHGTYIRCACKLHGGDNPTAFVMNQESGLWSCHTGGCGSGDIYTLVEKMEDVDFQSAVKFVAEFYNIDIENMEIKARTESYYKELQAFVKAIKSRKKKTQEAIVLPSDLKELTSFRKFKQETIEKFGIKFASSVSVKNSKKENVMLFNRLLLPIEFNQSTIGYALRRTNSTQNPKWFFQPTEIKTGDILYNYDNVKHASEIVVCEGMFDVWAFDEINVPAVCTFGAHITDEQYKLLMKTGADIISGFDGDKAGKIATSVLYELFKNKANVSTIQFNIDEDPESISRGELLERYKSRTKKRI